ncbi:MAG: bifunctional folylpolyglutamate synthase/dihydrofolate synthase [Bacteroidales bacterium]
MTFEETTQFLYNQLPVFQQSGASAYKPGLQNTEALDQIFDHPHHAFKTIHVGGTNGKGSVSHTLAAILQKAGYKVGLYTSPHLVDFRERIRVNGEMISKEYVIDFVANHFDKVSHIHPSFFELTMMMAFQYFRQQGVDIAVIEVGLGGRLDSTNIIDPELSVITNISFDHIQLLGDTLEKIASEKAGIIKTNVPVVIGEANEKTSKIFLEKAKEVNTDLYFAEEVNPVQVISNTADGSFEYDSLQYPGLVSELSGDCQIKNTQTILTALSLLKTSGLQISDNAVYEGFRNVTTLTGLQGRWQKISETPLSYCDTGHNEAGISYIVDQLKRQNCKRLRIVIGMVNDKDVNHVLALLPKDAIYYFTRASVARSLSETEFADIARTHGLEGSTYPSVADAYNQALNESEPDDFIFTGGSNFIVADLLSALNQSIV